MDTREAGKLGGAARAMNQTPAQLSAIGLTGAQARWGRPRGKRAKARKRARIAAQSRKANR